MIVEIQGAWLSNAGAELMLLTTLDRLRAIHPGVEIAMDPRWFGLGNPPPPGVRSIFPPRWRAPVATQRAVQAVDRLTRQGTARLRRSFGMVEAHRVDVLLDVSGFAISDQWGPDKARDRVGRAADVVATGGRAAWLPQSMGPFTDGEVAAQARRLLDVAEVVYVRDATSFAAMTALGHHAARLRRAPDLTFGLPRASVVQDVVEVLLVPNARMVDPGRLTSVQYVELLAAAGRVALAEGRSVEILLHTREQGDADVAGRLAAALDQVPIRGPFDALTLRGWLSSADLVIGSRFHALLGAAAHNVPFVGLGWSHKYLDLAAELGLSAISAPDLEPESVERSVRVLLDPTERAAVRTTLETYCSRARRDLDDLWDEVAQLVLK